MEGHPRAEGARFPVLSSVKSRFQNQVSSPRPVHPGGSVLEAEPRWLGRTPGRALLFSPGPPGVFWGARPCPLPRVPSPPHILGVKDPGWAWRHWGCSRPGAGQGWGSGREGHPPRSCFPAGWGRGARRQKPCSRHWPGIRPAPLTPGPAWTAVGPQPGQGPLTGPPPAPTRRQRAPAAPTPASGPATACWPLDGGRYTSGAAALGPLFLLVWLARPEEGARGAGAAGTGQWPHFHREPWPLSGPRPIVGLAWLTIAAFVVAWLPPSALRRGRGPGPPPFKGEGRNCLPTSGPHGETGGKGARRPGR